MNEAFAKALIAAQKDLPAIEPDAVNPHFHSKFVSLDHLLAKSLPVLNRHGLALVQFPSFNELGAPTLTTHIVHESGDMLSGQSLLHLVKADPQAHGSAVTYGRRYSAAAALGISSERDDDAESAMPANKTAGENATTPQTHVAEPAGDLAKGAAPIASSPPAASPAAETEHERNERWAKAWDERPLGPLREHIASCEDAERLRLYQRFESERRERTGNPSRKGILTGLAERIQSLEGDEPQATVGTDDSLSSPVSPADPEPAAGGPIEPASSSSENGSLLRLQAALGWIAEQPASVDNAEQWTPTALLAGLLNSGAGAFGSLEEVPEEWLAAIWNALPEGVRGSVERLGPESLMVLAGRVK